MILNIFNKIVKYIYLKPKGVEHEVFRYVQGQNPL